MENKQNVERIYLVGFMGAGKTTFGKMLASKLGFDFVDTDQLFEKKYKTTVDLFFKKYGEELFRKLEREILHLTFDMDKVVVATGGGTPCFYDNMEQIKRNGLSLYLKMAPKVLYDRLVHAKKVRPLVAEKSDEELLDYIKHKLSEREIFYKKSDYIISGLSLDIDFILDLIRRYPL